MKEQATASRRFRYRLTLAVEDFGGRSFAAEAANGSQCELSTSLASDISRMLGILNAPPVAGDLLGAMTEYSYDSVYGLLAGLHRHWSASNHFEDCIRVTVDVGKLCEGDDEAAEMARSVLRHCGFATEEEEAA